MAAIQSASVVVDSAAATANGTTDVATLMSVATSNRLQQSTTTQTPNRQHRNDTGSNNTRRQQQHSVHDDFASNISAAVGVQTDNRYLIDANAVNSTKEIRSLHGQAQVKHQPRTNPHHQLPPTPFVRGSPPVQKQQLLKSAATASPTKQPPAYESLSTTTNSGNAKHHHQQQQKTSIGRSNYWKHDLYVLQEKAPRPIMVECVNNKAEALQRRPDYYGDEFHGLIDRQLADAMLTEIGWSPI